MLVRTIALTSMFLLCAAAPATTAPSTTAPSTRPAAVIGWAEAGKHVGETVTVTGPVMGTHPVGTTTVVLNVGKDFPAKDRFTVMMPFNEAAGSADDQFIGKTITVTGTVKLYKAVPEIVTKNASDVTVQK